MYLRSARRQEVEEKNPQSDQMRFIPKGDEISSDMQLHLTRLSGVGRYLLLSHSRPSEAALPTNASPQSNHRVLLNAIIWSGGSMMLNDAALAELSLIGPWIDVNPLNKATTTTRLTSNATSKSTSGQTTHGATTTTKNWHCFECASTTFQSRAGIQGNLNLCH